jgi:ATP-dependent exoDNAse (exonuclease V) beta subunit
MLKLDVRETMGLRQAKLLQADEAEGRSSKGKKEYDRWREARAAMIAGGETLSLRTAIATEHAADPGAQAMGRAAAIELVQSPRSPDRRHGTRFGTMVHAVLSRIALDADRTAVAAAAVFFARTLGASEDETQATVEAVLTALSSPVIRRAALATTIRREAPLSLVLGDGTLVEGVADLAFLDATEGWTVVDFKTDRQIESRLDEYRAQLALYMRAITNATGSPSRGILLHI